jgi:hypothetical protein
MPRNTRIYKSFPLAPALPEQSGTSWHPAARCSLDSDTTMQKKARSAASAALMAIALLTLGCAPLGAATEIPGRSSNTVVNAEVRSIDTRSARISLRDSGGRNRVVRYDRRTMVVYRQRSYPVGALERGDRVNVRLTYDRSGQAWADRIDVRESIRDRGRGRARVERVGGRVARVDTRAGAFTLEAARNRSVLVLLNRNASRSDRARLERLRRGERVRAEVRPIGGNRYELVRFR